MSPRTAARATSFEDHAWDTPLPLRETDFPEEAPEQPSEDALSNMTAAATFPSVLNSQDVDLTSSAERWMPKSESGKHKPARSRQATAEIADARKLVAAIALGLLMALGLTLAAAWGTEPEMSRLSSSPDQLTPAAITAHLNG
ncbi:hypothetical protein J0X15_01035 [Roseibium sp. CAU 1637]|uniref:Uncharacterized protein n=2 Tax=Roseibium TaxID=150830 RepID=A0A939J3K5_9HYPH|nr:hypothetical protein [Roseibium limicola]MBO0343790.1 hypothetical protein [Roseibium limicola]